MTKISLKRVGAVDTVTMKVRRDSLKPAAWNPEIRIQLRYLKPLRDSMEAEGFWDFSPILVDRQGTIIDGHRRWTVAKLLNIEEVPVTIVDDDADRIWAMFNGTRMDLTGAQAMQANALGLKTRPPKYSSLMTLLEDTVGQEGIRVLGQRGVSPHIIKSARRIAHYCMIDEKEFLKATVYWLALNSQMSVLAVRAMRDGIKGDILEKAIRGNKPLTANYS